MRSVFAKEEELDAKRDALLTYLESQNKSGKMTYRSVHYHIWEFVRSLKTDEPFHPQKIPGSEPR